MSWQSSGIKHVAKRHEREIARRVVVHFFFEMISENKAKQFQKDLKPCCGASWPKKKSPPRQQACFFLPARDSSETCFVCLSTRFRKSVLADNAGSTSVPYWLTVNLWADVTNMSEEADAEFGKTFPLRIYIMNDFAVSHGCKKKVRMSLLPTYFFIVVMSSKPPTSDAALQSFMVSPLIF